MTSLSLPVARRRFLFMLWFSAALHGVVIGLTRLPPPSSIVLPPVLEVLLPQPQKPTQAAKPLVEPKLLPVQPRQMEPRPELAPKPEPVVQQVPQQTTPALPPTTQVTSTPAPASVQEAPGPQVNIPVVVDTHYYSAKELDLQPSALRKPEPAYPARADEEGVSGRVVVRLHLESNGSISKTEVVSVTPGGVFGEMFRKSTLDSLKNIRFRPAQRNGQPVRAVVEIPVVFEPNN